MKYSIFINQKAVATHFKDTLDLIDMTVFDYCRDIITSPNVKLERIMYDGKAHTWINYTHLIDSMPLLGIKTNDVIRRRMNTLVEAGLLSRHIVKTMAYFCLGEKSDLLLFDKDPSDDPVEPTPGESTPTPEAIPSPATPDAATVESEASDDAPVPPPPTYTIPDSDSTPNSKVDPNCIDGVPQPESGDTPHFKDGHTPTEKRGYYNTNINQSDQEIKIKGKEAATAAAPPPSEYIPGPPALSALEITFFKIWEQTHCLPVRYIHKERIRLVLEKYTPSHDVIAAAIKKNKREDWACEDIVRDCNKDHTPQRETTALEMRDYVEGRRRLQRQAGLT